MLICTTKKIVLFQYYKKLFQYYFVLLYTTQYYILQYYSSNSPVLLCTTKYYSVIQSTNPGLLCTTQYYSNTTPYKKVLLQHYAVLFHYYPSTTLLLLCFALQVFLLTLQTKTINQPASQPVWPAGRWTRYWPDAWTNQNNQPASQPASQFGRPAGEHGNGRPAGTHGSGRPDGRETAGRPAGNEIANKSPVLSSKFRCFFFQRGITNFPSQFETNYKSINKKVGNGAIGEMVELFFWLKWRELIWSTFLRQKIWRPFWRKRDLEPFLGLMDRGVTNEEVTRSYRMILLMEES